MPPDGRKKDMNTSYKKVYFSIPYKGEFSHKYWRSKCPGQSFKIVISSIKSLWISLILEEATWNSTVRTSTFIALALDLPDYESTLSSEVFLYLFFIKCAEIFLYIQTSERVREIKNEWRKGTNRLDIFSLCPHISLWGRCYSNFMYKVQRNRIVYSGGLQSK